MDLLTILRQIARDQSSIRLMNIYKGLPISYDTNITSVGASEIQVPCSKNHIACLYYQGESYLMGDEIPVVIRSKVARLNLAKDYAVFSNFESAQDNIGKRMQIRVEPEEPIMVGIEFKGSAFEFLAPLADISANGASVFFESTMFPGRLSKPGNELTLSIPLPDSMTHKIKKLTGEKNIWIRTTGSTIVSQLIDSFVVIFIAFYVGKRIQTGQGDAWSLQQVMVTGTGNYIYKFVIALLMTPIIYIVHYVIEKYLGDTTATQLKNAAMGKESE